MSTAELKKKLLEKIADSNNEELLLEVYQLLQIEDEAVGVYPLSEEQITVVRESQEQVKKGKFLTGDDADKEIDEWLGK
jgi:hypothetical protein